MAFEVKAQKNMKEIRKEFQRNGVFYSSLDLAEKLKSYLPEDATEVYDPTCGAGALLSVFPDTVKKYGQELDPSQAKEASENLVNCQIVSGDTLTAPAFAGKKFKAITANPPFSVKWEPMPLDERFSVAPALAPKSKADYAFILHCLHYLSDDGKAACLDAHGVLFRGSAEYKIRRWLIENNYIERLVAFGAGYFVDTSIPTVCIVLSKSKKTTDIIFEDTVLNMERTVTVEEIAYNDYNLNFPRYIAEEKPEDVYDYVAETADFLDTIKESLKVGIATAKTIYCELTPPLGDYKKFIRELKEIIENAEKEID